NATPLHPMLHRHIGSIPIDLERADVGALRRALQTLPAGEGGCIFPEGALSAALQTLEAGKVVGIFPEGPFSVSGRLEPGLPGVALLALRSGVPVVPARIRGTYEALTRRRADRPRRVPLAVRFGPARCFSDDASRDRRSARLSVTGRIMDDIASLLS